jgi:hypothetical protein
MRRSVSIYGATSTVSIATPREPPQNITHARVKAQPSKNHHQNGLGVQPPVKQITKETTYDNRGNKDKR